jgi:hypothetical protein
MGTEAFPEASRSPVAIGLSQRAHVPAALPWPSPFTIFDGAGKGKRLWPGGLRSGLTSDVEKSNETAGQSEVEAVPSTALIGVPQRETWSAGISSNPRSA